MLKKSASSLPWLCRRGSHRLVVAILSDLRAHRLAALRGVRAYVLGYALCVKRAAALLDELFWTFPRTDAARL